MMQKQKGSDKKKVSTLKLAIGAASLFLFIVGVKRSFKLDEVQAENADPEEAKPKPK